MKPTSLKRRGQVYFAGQWAEAGVYRCLDPCLPWERTVVLRQDGLLPDPSGGWVARLCRVQGREAERLLAEAGYQAGQQRVVEAGQSQATSMAKGGEMTKRPRPR